MMAMTVDRVLVTVCLPVEGKALDMELPAFLPMSELRPKLLETLKSMEPHKYSGITEIDILLSGRRMTDESSLASCGAWDGATLEISELR